MILNGRLQLAVYGLVKRGKLPFMNKPRESHLIAKLRDLPPQRVAEVEDFIDFLRSRDRGRALTRAATRAAEPAFARIWENDADAAYDRL